MKPSELKQVLKTMIENKVKVTPFIWGQHGIGKSTIIREVASELGYKSLTLILSQKEAVDLAGMPFVFKDDQTGHTVMANHLPQWFNDAVKTGKVIIFLDEFNQARREVMSAAFELVLDKRLNNVYLPEDVFVIAAGNPCDDRYDTTAMSEALIDRFVHIQLHPEVDEWLQWGITNKTIHSDVLNFISMQKTFLYNADARDDKFSFEIKPSPRAHERLSVIHSLPLNNVTKTELYRGIVGVEAATAFVASLQDKEEPLQYEDIVKLNKKTKAKLKKWLESEEVIRNDLVTTSINNLVNHAIAHPEQAVNDFSKLKDFIFLLRDSDIQLVLSGFGKVKHMSEKIVEDSELLKRIELMKKAIQKTKEKEGSK